jgi:Na+-transporting methylmalonyl-CoA/oxaloacetate decarboxylase gamma subunit
MGNTITLSETFVLALGGMAIVFAIIVLYAISLVAKLSKATTEIQEGNKVDQNAVQNFASNNVVAQKPMQNFDDSNDEEDRLVVALAASIAAANDKPDSYFHISKITRVK